MTVQNEIQVLIAELAYLDHENNTDVAEELTDTVHSIRVGNLTRDEAVELLEDRLQVMQLNSILEKDEHIRLVQNIINKLPGLLFR